MSPSFTMRAAGGRKQFPSGARFLVPLPLEQTGKKKKRVNFLRVRCGMQILRGSGPGFIRAIDRDFAPP